MMPRLLESVQCPVDGEAIPLLTIARGHLIEHRIGMWTYCGWDFATDDKPPGWSYGLRRNVTCVPCLTVVGDDLLEGADARATQLIEAGAR